MSSKNELTLLILSSVLVQVAQRDTIQWQGRRHAQAVRLVRILRVLDPAVVRLVAQEHLQVREPPLALQLQPYVPLVHTHRAVIRLAQAVQREPIRPQQGQLHVRRAQLAHIAPPRV